MRSFSDTYLSTLAILHFFEGLNVLYKPNNNKNNNSNDNNNNND